MREKPGQGQRPKVTIIMPCYNEEKYIRGAIESLIDDWVLTHGEFIVADGQSSDKTREIIMDLVHYWNKKHRERSELMLERLSEENRKKENKREQNKDNKDKDQDTDRDNHRVSEGFLRLIDNPGRVQASGMNLGIKEARGEFIVRADAHCLYPPGYVRRCIELLERLEPIGVANVGGYIHPLGQSLTQLAVCLALSHPLGAGDARWRLGKKSGFVDTVYLGTFRRRVLAEIGFYDPGAHPNEDAELNLRLIKSQKKIYLDSSIKVYYFVRDSFKRLAHQFYHYGRGRAYTTWKHRRLTSWRQLAPVLLLGGMMVTISGGFFWPWAWLFPGLYFFSLALSSFSCLKGANRDDLIPSKDLSWKEKFSLWPRILFSFMTIHFCWATGFVLRMGKLLVAGKKE